GLARDLLLLGAAHGRDHARPGPFGELDRGLADRTRAARDQHRLSLDAAVLKQAAVRGHPGDAEAGPGGEARPLRQRHGVVRGYADVLRAAAEGAAALRLPDPYALARARGRHARSDAVDHARSVLM